VKLSQVPNVAARALLHDGQFLSGSDCLVEALVALQVGVAGGWHRPR
jgi:hypothetical protein